MLSVQCHTRLGRINKPSLQSSSNPGKKLTNNQKMSAEAWQKCQALLAAMWAVQVPLRFLHNIPSVFAFATF